MSTLAVLTLALSGIAVTISGFTIITLRRWAAQQRRLAHAKANLTRARQEHQEHHERTKDRAPNPDLAGNIKVDRAQTVVDAMVGGWPPDPSIECGFTALDGRRWIHRPWEGWQVAGPDLARRPRRARRWWPW